MTAVIAYQPTSDAPIQSISLAHDAHLVAAGRILIEHYATPARVSALIALGDLTVLGAQMGDAPHPVTNPKPNTCVALHRDWRDDLVIRHAADRESLTRTPAPYVYLFTGGEWLVKLRWRDDWVVLMHALLTLALAAEGVLV